MNDMLKDNRSKHTTKFAQRCLQRSICNLSSELHRRMNVVDEQLDYHVMGTNALRKNSHSKCNYVEILLHHNRSNKTETHLLLPNYRQHGKLLI